MDGLLLTMIPLMLQPYVQLLFTAIAACSLLGAALKPVLGDPSESDGWLKRAVYAVLHAADFVALNSETVRAKRARIEAAVAASSK